jgi:uncharacterized integral membrane protein
MAAYDFDDLSSTAKNQYIADAFLVLFIVLFNILLLNLLIAILSSTYAMLEGEKLVLYINEILKLRSTLEYDKQCSALVSSFPPYNIIALLFSPFIMIKKEPVTLNLVLFHIEYAPLLLILLIVFIAGNLVLIPFAYIKGIYVNLQQLWSNKVEGNLPYRCLRLLVWLLFGPIILLMNLVADIIAFIMHLYQNKMSYRKQQMKAMKMTQSTYDMIQTSFENEHKKGRKRIKYENVILPIKEEMKVLQNIQYVIF